ncbi:hypothetical protein DEU40_1134 [Chryseobacterium sp. AG844]|nr:hypothetical protein DEU40_1134 [Chryseobacterium sp. AG844]
MDKNAWFWIVGNSFALQNFPKNGFSIYFNETFSFQKNIYTKDIIELYESLNYYF